MPRNQIIIGNDIPDPKSPNQVQQTILLSTTGTSTGVYEYNFLDGSITYFERNIKQSFEYVLIDNIGTGSIRICFNKLGLNMSSPVNGAKTLKGGDTLYIQDSIRNVGIYFIESSTVELVLITK